MVDIDDAFLYGDRVFDVGASRYEEGLLFGGKKLARAEREEREKRLAEKILRLENLEIPENFDFQKLTALSMECRIKLERYRPRTIAQASRISGVSPADISVLLVYFGR